MVLQVQVILSLEIGQQECMHLMMNMEWKGEGLVKVINLTTEVESDRVEGLVIL